jgi:hypothetical protein
VSIPALGTSGEIVKALRTRGRKGMSLSMLELKVKANPSEIIAHIEKLKKQGAIRTQDKNIYLVEE